MADSFSPRGEAFVLCPLFFVLSNQIAVTAQASPLREKLSSNRLFGTDLMTDVGDTAPKGR
jgi:hypothetical protein